LKKANLAFLNETHLELIKTNLDKLIEIENLNSKKCILISEKLNTKNNAYCQYLVYFIEKDKVYSYLDKLNSDLATDRIILIIIISVFGLIFLILSLAFGFMSID